MGRSITFLMMRFNTWSRAGHIQLWIKSLLCHCHKLRILMRLDGSCVRSRDRPMHVLFPECSWRWLMVQSSCMTYVKTRTMTWNSRAQCFKWGYVYTAVAHVQGGATVKWFRTSKMSTILDWCFRVSPELLLVHHL